MSFEPCYDEHIRPNTRLLDMQQLKEALDKKGVEYVESIAGGLVVTNNSYIKALGQDNVSGYDVDACRAGNAGRGRRKYT